MTITPDQLIRQAQNRQAKKGIPSEQSVAWLASQGVVMSVEEYKAAYNERRAAIRKQGKQDGNEAATRQRQAHTAKLAAQQAERFPGMTDAQVVEYLDAAMSEAHRQLLALGAVHTGDSPTTESRYYTLDGRKIRLSAHALPDNDERAHAALNGADELHLTLRRYRPIENIGSWIKEQI